MQTAVDRHDRLTDHSLGFVIPDLPDAEAKLGNEAVVIQ